MGWTLFDKDPRPIRGNGVEAGQRAGFSHRLEKGHAPAPPATPMDASKLAAYGHKDLATDIADKTVVKGIKSGINGHCDLVSGKALGAPDYCRSSPLVTSLLDRASRRSLR